MTGNYTLRAGSLEVQGSLDGDGILEQKLPVHIKRAEVEMGAFSVERRRRRGQHERSLPTSLPRQAPQRLHTAWGQVRAAANATNRC